VLTALAGMSVIMPTFEVKARLAYPDPETGAGELLIRGPDVAAGHWRVGSAAALTRTLSAIPVRQAPLHPATASLARRVVARDSADGG
jgi:hypothetical protein